MGMGVSRFNTPKEALDHFLKGTVENSPHAREKAFLCGFAAAVSMLEGGQKLWQETFELCDSYPKEFN